MYIHSLSDYCNLRLLSYLHIHTYVRNFLNSSNELVVAMFYTEAYKDYCVYCSQKEILLHNK